MIQLIRKVIRPRRGPAPLGTAAQDVGFAMIVVIGYGMLIVLIMSLLAGYALSSLKGARREQDFTAAVAAAQAGVDDVVAKLRISPASVGSANWAAVPGSLDPNGAPCDLTPGTVPVNCPQYKYKSVALPSGDYEIYAVGKTRDNVQRAVKVTAHKANFTDYLYYSEVEAADPADGFAYPRLFYPSGGPPACGKRAWPAADARPATGCQVPTWRDGDKTDKSRVHSNDLIQTAGTPIFNSQVTTAYDKCKPTVVSPTCYKSKSGTPTFGKGAPTYSTGLDLAVSAPTTLKTQAGNTTGPFTATYTQGCVYTGPTRIKFAGNQMYVWSPQTNASLHPECGGGLTTDITAALSVAFSGSGLSLNVLLNTTPLDQLLSALPVALQPPPVAIPKNNVIYVKDNPVTQNGVYCLLGKVLGLTGTLDTNVTQGNCQAGNLFVSGAFDGRLTMGTDGDVLIMTDLKYSDATGSNFARDGSDRLGIVAKGAVEVYNPLQCTLAVGTCLSLDPSSIGGLFSSIVPLGHSIEVDAAIMSLEHRFGTQLPILQLDVYASLLNGLVSKNLPTPSIKLYGSVAQKFRGILGADVLGLDVTVNNVDVVSAQINIGYKADYTYDQHLRSDPPPYFPTPANIAWTQDTFAEIPLNKLPAGI
jgi:hypothetical protein